MPVINVQVYFFVLVNDKITLIRRINTVKAKMLCGKKDVLAKHHVDLLFYSIYNKIKVKV